MRSRDILKAFVADTDKATSSKEPAPRTSPVMKEMGKSLDILGEEAAAAKTLREQLASGDHVVDLDPAVIEGSFLRDRIALEGQPDPVFEDLQRSIEDSGQQVPILVRPHPDKANWYQVAYGHRRLRAVANLGRPVRAFIRQLTDDELIVAQGQENGARVDLSFIEKALFAHRMESRGFDRNTIMKALALHKGDVSYLLQIAKDISHDIILAVGPAPKIGRTRWLALADKLRDDRLLKVARKQISEPNFSVVESDKRFELLLRSITYKQPEESVPTTFQSGNGTDLVTLTRSKRLGKMTISSAEFTEFLAAKLPELITEFEKG